MANLKIKKFFAVAEITASALAIGAIIAAGVAALLGNQATLCLSIFIGILIVWQLAQSMAREIRSLPILQRRIDAYYGTKEFQKTHLPREEYVVEIIENLNNWGYQELYAKELFYPPLEGLKSIATHRAEGNKRVLWADLIAIKKNCSFHKLEHFDMQWIVELHKAVSSK